MRNALALAAVLSLGACGGGADLTAPATGTLEITTATSGADLDPDGYTVKLDASGPGQAISATGSVTFSSVPAGSHTVVLTGVSANCSVSGENPRSATVGGGSVVEVVFSVSCQAGTGALRVVTATTGPSQDADGYSVIVDAQPPRAIPVTGESLVGGLAPGSHTVALSGIASNCALAGENPLTVTVASGAVTEARFSLTCATPTLREWTAMESGTNHYLSGVWGSAPNDVFAVGEPGDDFRSGIFHFDGGAWSQQAEPADVLLRSIWGSGPSDVFAVGFSPNGQVSFDGTIMHYDGASWSHMTGPGIGRPAGPEQNPIEVVFQSVWGTGSSNIYAVGYVFEDGAYQGLVAHYNGSAWSAMPTTNPLDRNLHDVHGTSGQDVWAVGGISPRSGDDVTLSEGILWHFDGTQWSESIIDVELLSLSGVWAASPTAVFVVGSIFDEAQQSFRGAIYRYDGTAWTSMPVPPTRRIAEVWGASERDVYAVGDDGILHYDGATWAKVPDVSAALLDIWGSSSVDVFAVGTGGVILHRTP
ncbi:MAG: hypothetical protein ABIZ96_06380 [Gemmatimonadales bacterium]